MFKPRFPTDFVQVGQITVTPDSGVINVGAFSLGAGEDTIWVEVQQVSPDGPWPFSFGILGFETTYGHELGTIKVFPSSTSSNYKLSVGLPPSVQTGVITFEPRSYNLAWVRAGTPWSLNFSARSGQSCGVPGDGPAFGTRATLGVLGDLLNRGVSYAFGDAGARVRLTDKN